MVDVPVGKGLHVNFYIRTYFERVPKWCLSIFKNCYRLQGSFQLEHINIFQLHNRRLSGYIFEFYDARKMDCSLSHLEIYRTLIPFYVVHVSYDMKFSNFCGDCIYIDTTELVSPNA